MAESAINSRKSAIDAKRHVAQVDTNKLVSYTLDSLEGGVVTISREGTITSFNSVAERILGYDSGEAVGMHYTRVMPALGDMKRLVAMVQAALATGATFSSEEAVVRTKDRRRIPIGITISQLRDEHGNSFGVVLMFKNLAEIKRIRDQIMRTEQMASLGYLAAGIAHELRNPLGSLQGLAELLQEDMLPGEPRRTYTDTFIREIDRMNKLVEDLLCFAQPPIAAVDRRCLDDLVADSLAFAGYDFQDRTITVKTAYAATPDVLVDIERFSRALLNIIRNAYQACPEGGTITVATGTSNRGRLPRVFVKITNTGSYIEPHMRDKIFQPFFTLKKHGTGLGLSIASAIVKGHSGTIEVDSDPEEGTSFTIDLPSADSLSQSVSYIGIEQEVTHGNSHTG
ncbi:MAG TPA: ATP-binding protein [Planctomycetota bacterium]|nr:ATP-binding protein [Planctomycetota bacterium]